MHRIPNDQNKSFPKLDTTQTKHKDTKRDQWVIGKYVPEQSRSGDQYQRDVSSALSGASWNHTLLSSFLPFQQFKDDLQNKQRIIC